MVIGKAQGIGYCTDCHIGVAQKEICPFYLLGKNILLEADSGYLPEIPGQIFFIITEMRSNIRHLQVIVYEVTYIINNIIIKLLLKGDILGCRIFFFSQRYHMLIGYFADNQGGHIIRIVGIVTGAYTILKLPH